MPRQKKTSKIVESASVRLAGIKSIDKDLDLGNGATVKAYNSLIEETKKLLEDYNTVLSLVDEKLNLYQVKEKELKDLHERMLISVAAKYGKNSNEYEKAGGKKKSERKRPTKKS
ncbi:MAG: hypothetical protein MUC49_19175 [Raineya sp.]|jgi:hypothetical protein|nr:hypothetical protein [Raineya sp.]